MPMITVFTPTYNRASFLISIYYNLCHQRCKDLEWLIVDDGSTDETKKVVHGIIEQNLKLSYHFPIIYLYKNNGGKHTAINVGVREARGELFLILDSDDELPEESLGNTWNAYLTIRGDKSYGGVVGKMSHRNGKPITLGYFDENKSMYLDANSIEFRYRYGIMGDMCEVFRTEVLREFFFPEIQREKFVPEDLVWNRIAQRYRLRLFDKVVYYRDYLDGGLTDNIIKIRMASPIAATTYYAELLLNTIPFVEKIKAAINYYRFEACLNNKTPRIHTLPSQYRILKWVGILIHISDKLRVGRGAL